MAKSSLPPMSAAVQAVGWSDGRLRMVGDVMASLVSEVRVAGWRSIGRAFRNGHCREPLVLTSPRQIGGCVVLHYSDLMTRYRGRIRSEEPAVQSDPTRTSLVEPAVLKHVVVSSVVGQAIGTLPARERTIRIGSMRLMPAAEVQRFDPDEGRRR